MSKTSIIASLFSTLLCLCAAGCDSPSGPSIIECGGGAGFICPPGMYCDYGSKCGGLDNTGQCRVQATSCPPEDNPVCGCDKKTYDSTCYARASGVSIDYEGACIGQKNRSQDEED